MLAIELGFCCYPPFEPIELVARIVDLARLLSFALVLDPIKDPCDMSPIVEWMLLVLRFCLVTLLTWFDIVVSTLVALTG